MHSRLWQRQVSFQFVSNLIIKRIPVDIVMPLNYYLDANEEPLIIPLKDFRAGAGLNFSATNEVCLYLLYDCRNLFR